MSGGSYNYVFEKFSEAADGLRSRHRDDPHVIAFAGHLDAIAAVMKDIEWADSYDTSWTPEIDAAIRALIAPSAEIDAATERAMKAHEILTATLQRAEAAR